MSRKPNPSQHAVADFTSRHYGLDLTRLEPLDLGLDPTASAFKLYTSGGESYFLKVRSSALNPSSLTVPHLLRQNGVPNIIAPLEARSGELWGPLDGNSAVLYPFVEGENAVRAGLTEQQWTEFGQTLRAVHAPGIALQVAGQLPRETFGIPSLAKVFEVEEAMAAHDLAHPAQQQLAGIWAERRDLILRAGARAKQLGATLQKAEREFVVCHSDIHAANIMVSGGRFYLVDWDSPLLAPPERDLLFVVGSPIARRVLPQEEARFFAGYGDTRVTPEALAYFRYERAIEDVGEFAYSILFDTGRDDADVLLDLRLFAGLFAPGDVLDLAQSIDPGD